MSSKNGKKPEILTSEDVEEWLKAEFGSLETAEKKFRYTDPDTLAGFDVIGTEAFRDFKHLKRIVIPEGVEEIGTRAFYGCSRLRSVQLPSTLKRIGEEAFACCYRLDTISLPNDLNTIAARAFAHTGFWSLPYVPNRVGYQLGIRYGDPFEFTPFWHRATKHSFRALVSRISHRCFHRSSRVLHSIYKYRPVNS